MKGRELDSIIRDESKLKDVLIIDVRPEEQFANGHIEHSINIPTSKILDRIEELEEYREKHIILYCNTGRNSAKAYNILKEEGFNNISDAEGVKQYSYNLIK
ncbi:MAG: rhodanese-like domain-containing protein [Andreesenia angusta]|nr:rhodanese-like domain-containing protein [Andreesenia angusta]